MEDSFMKSEFVANAVITYIRNGKFPNNSEAEYLDKMAMIDKLRGCISDDDLPKLLDIVKNQDDQFAGLSISLLRAYSKTPDAVRCFEEQWEISTPFLKNRLMWRMLDNDDPEFSQKWREIFFEFVMTEWETFRDFNLNFYGSSNEALHRILSRIGDQTFPNSKKWIYLCSAPETIDDPNVVRTIINLGSSWNDEFTTYVVNRLVDKFFPENSRGPSRAPNPYTFKSDGIEYIADAVVSSIFAGNKPGEEDADFLNRIPIVDKLRERISERDIPWLLDALNKETGEFAGLLLSLVRKFDEKIEVKEFLHKRWKNADAFLRAHLMWRILDDPSLPQDWNRKIFGFILSEWKTFHEVSLKFLGTPETVVTQALKRIGNPSFPDTKKWAYLCRVVDVAADEDAAKSLVRLGLTMKDPFAREVAETLLEKYY